MGLVDNVFDEKSASDTELVNQARRGNGEAFGQLVRRHQRLAVSVAYRFLNNTEDASDVTQDAFVRAYRSLDQLADPARFGAWLLRIVSNLSLNFRRSRKNRSAASLEDIGTVAETLQSHANRGRSNADIRADGDALSGELAAAIARAIEALPEKQAMALVLFSVEGVPQRDVAEILDCSVELVKWNVFQARKTLRAALAAFL